MNLNYDQAMSSRVMLQDTTSRCSMLDASATASARSSQPTISVNRIKASKHRDDPSKDPDGYRSVFGQIFSQLRGVKYESFRGKRDEQIWRVNFQGEGSIDVGGPF